MTSAIGGTPAITDEVAEMDLIQLLPLHEAERLEALHSLEILDTASEEAFDELAALAASTCQTPMAMISLVDADRQWFKARVELGGDRHSSGEISFCGHTILQAPRPLHRPRCLGRCTFCGQPARDLRPLGSFFMRGRSPGNAGRPCSGSPVRHRPPAAAIVRRTGPGAPHPESSSRGTAPDTPKPRQAPARRGEALRESEQRFRTFVDHATDAFFLQDDGGVILDVNCQACESLGCTREELVGKTPFDFDPDLTPALIEEIGSRLNAQEMVAFESRHRRQNGTLFPVEVRGRAFWEGGRRFLVSLARDVSARKHDEALLEGQKRILERIIQGEPLADVLTFLCRTIEELAQGEMLASVLLLDADGVHLRHGAAPSLPEGYIRAVDGIAIGPSVGSCGTAAYRRAPVYVSDIASDPLGSALCRRGVTLRPACLLVGAHPLQCCRGTRHLRHVLPAASPTHPA